MKGERTATTRGGSPRAGRSRGRAVKAPAPGAAGGSRRQRGRQGPAASSCSLQKNAAHLAPGSGHRQALSADNSGTGRRRGPAPCGNGACPGPRAVSRTGCPGQGAGSTRPSPGCPKVPPSPCRQKQIWRPGVRSARNPSDVSWHIRSSQELPPSPSQRFTNSGTERTGVSRLLSGCPSPPGEALQGQPSPAAATQHACEQRP